MAYLACDKDGTEWICSDKPSREPVIDDEFSPNSIWADAWEQIELPKGSIAKLIGRELTWADEPYELI